ncbi:Protein of unknown function [Nocardioides terrae]|uniref:DUF3105 domain-containing protein n=1 Tax=Nocardioides terrae TaxID=574651 RepID=A0A1I1DKZ9_9ACTN|nr:DUF3105 domain-containing protein [Nocardioides terrae]SFB75537.1 Protein of unknown function [Nocardioides terrae]
MAKKTAAQNNRRAVIDDIRKKQKGADRRRGFAIVGVCAVVAILIVGAAAFRPVKDWWDERKFNDVNLAEVGAPASACDKITTKKADGNQQHVPSGTPVDYTTTPPAFGPHWNEAGLAPVPMEKKFYAWGERPELEALVHNLEHGYTIVWYDKTANDDGSEIAALRAIGSKFPGDSNMRYKLKIVPWLPSDEGGKKFPEGKHIAITHWSAGGDGQTDATKQVGVFQYCSSVSGTALKDFMTKYPYTDSPEPLAM